MVFCEKRTLCPAPNGHPLDLGMATLPLISTISLSDLLSSSLSATSASWMPANRLLTLLDPKHQSFFFFFFPFTPLTLTWIPWSLTGCHHAQVHRVSLPLSWQNHPLGSLQCPAAQHGKEPPLQGCAPAPLSFPSFLYLPPPFSSPNSLLAPALLLIARRKSNTGIRREAEGAPT